MFYGAAVLLMNWGTLNGNLVEEPSLKQVVCLTSFF